MVFSTVHNESYHFKKILKHYDKVDFIKLMQKEIEACERKNHLRMRRRNDVPKGMQTTTLMWAFMHKRMSSSVLTKHESQLFA